MCGLSHASGVWNDFTRNPNKPIAPIGMPVQSVLEIYGQPAIELQDLSFSQAVMWDYGTFRVLISKGHVTRSMLW